MYDYIVEQPEVITDGRELALLMALAATEMDKASTARKCNACDWYWCGQCHASAHINDIGECDGFAE